MQRKITKFEDLHIEPEFPLTGIKESILTLKGKDIIINDFRFCKATVYEDDKCIQKDTVQIQFCFPDDDTNRITFTRSKILRKQLEQVDKSMLPISGNVREKDKCIFIK